MRAPAGLYFEEGRNVSGPVRAPHPVPDRARRVVQDLGVRAVKGLGDLPPVPETLFSVLGSQPFQVASTLFSSPLRRILRA